MIIFALSTLMGEGYKASAHKKTEGEERVTPKFVSESPMCTKHRMMLSDTAAVLYGGRG